MFSSALHWSCSLFLYSCSPASTADAPVKWDAVQLSPGDQCDIQDSEKLWHLGEVMTSGTTKDFVRVLLLGTEVPRNLTLPRSSARLAGPGVRSAGRRGGGAAAAEGELCEDLTLARLEELQQRVEDLDPQRQGQREGQGQRQGEGEGWHEVIVAVERVLTSSHPPALLPAVNHFLKGVLALLVRVVKEEEGEGLGDAQLALLQKLLFVDR
jgi:hypothetical protein